MTKKSTNRKTAKRDPFTDQRVGKKATKYRDKNKNFRSRDKNPKIHSPAGASSIYEMRRRKQANLLFLRHICAIKGIDWKEFVGEISIETPHSLSKWKRMVNAMEKEKGLYRQSAKGVFTESPENSSYDRASGGKEKRKEESGGEHYDKDGNLVLIEGDHVYCKIQGAWRDTGNKDKHPQAPFTKNKENLESNEEENDGNKDVEESGEEDDESTETL